MHSVNLLITLKKYIQFNFFDDKNIIISYIIIY
jgi:hypothetical protein